MNIKSLIRNEGHLRSEAAACVKTPLNNSGRPLSHGRATHLRRMFECDEYFNVLSCCCLLNAVHSVHIPPWYSLFSASSGKLTQCENTKSAFEQEQCVNSKSTMSSTPWPF